MTLPDTKSITLHISLLFAGVAAVVLCVMGYVIIASIEHHFDDQDRMAIVGKLALIQNILNEIDRGKTTENSQEKLTDALVGHHELSVRVTDALGQVIFASDQFASEQFVGDHADLSLPPEDYHAPQPVFLQTLTHQGHSYRGVAVTLVSAPLQKKYTVVMAINVMHHLNFLAAFTLQLLLIGATGLLLLVTMGWIATRRGLRPVWEMTQLAEGITAQRLDGRIDLKGLPTELRPLGTSFNEMLDRLRDALTRLSDFSSDIAHELRTPINNLMMQTQVSLAKPRSSEDYREILYSSMEEYERLARMISDMLFLAKADNGLMIPHCEQMSLHEEIVVVFEFYEALATEQDIALQVEGEASLMGDRLMIRRAFSNLLSNAIRHSQKHSRIVVVVEAYPHAVQVSISNWGDTIAEDKLPKIFDRFYRGDASRSRVDEGTGLGLAITRSIVEAHHGNICASSAQGKTVFDITFPTLAGA